METQDIVALVLVYLIIGVSLGVSRYLGRRGSGIDVRKVIHIGVGNFIFVWWAFTESWVMLAFFAIPFAALLFLAMLKNNPVSDSELGDLSQKRGHRTGLFLYTVSITLMIVLFGDHWTAATIGIVAMTYGDGFGSICGKRFGKHPSYFGKSWEGTFGVFAATALMSFVIILFYGFLSANGYYMGDTVPLIPSWAACIVAGLVASVTEMVSPGQLDNLIIPIVVASTMVLLGL